jgi:hypothetical protein
LMAQSPWVTIPTSTSSSMTSTDDAPDEKSIAEAVLHLGQWPVHA